MEVGVEEAAWQFTTQVTSTMEVSFWSMEDMDMTSMEVLVQSSSRTATIPHHLTYIEHLWLITMVIHHLIGYRKLRSYH